MKEIKTFWDFKHTTNNKNSLSGCGFDETINYLKVTDKVQPGIKVLEVGCGLGYVTQGFSEICDISVVDISSIGLDRVGDICEKTYLSTETELLPDNYFDLIICHNVVQHVPTVDLRREMNDFIRSLKTTGLFAVEFVGSNNIDDLGENATQQQVEAGILCRSPKFIGKMIQEFGGKYAEMFTAPVNVPPITSVHVFHITK